MSALIACLLCLALVVMQLLIGGARQVFGLPGYLLVAVCGLLVPMSKTTPSLRGACAPATLLMAAYVIGRCLVSPVAYLARYDLLMALGALLVYLITALYLTDSKIRLFIVYILSGAALAHAAVGAIQFKQNDNFMLLPGIMRPSYEWRASGFYICPNHLAGLLEMTGLMLLSVVCWAPIRTGLRVICGYAVLMCITGLALTGSRGGYLSVVFGLILFTTLSTWVIRGVKQERAWSMWLLMMFAATIFVGVGVLVMLRSEELSARLGLIYDPTNMRLLMWGAALKQFALNPFVGTGSGTYIFFGRFFRSPLVQADPIHVHCDYLELLAEYGLVGAVVVGVFLGLHLFSGFSGLRKMIIDLQSAKQLASEEAALLIGALCGIGALLVHSVVDFNFHIPANTLVGAFLFGILASPRQLQSVAVGRSAYRWVIPVLASILLAMAVRLMPGEYFGEKARIALREKSFAEAQGHAERALTYDRNNPDIFFYQGEALILLSFQTPEIVTARVLVERAVTSFEQGLKLFPRDTRLLLKLGQALDIAGRFEEAGTIFERAIANDPNFGNPYAYFGLHWKLLRRYGEAERYFLRARELGEPAISGPALQRIQKLREDPVFQQLMSLEEVRKNGVSEEQPPAEK
jgi:O-antigen ligase